MLLERERELRLMTDLLAGVGSLGGKVVLVRGEAGIGKSALVREFVKAHADEAHVYFGSCDDLLTPQPLGPFWDMARGEPSLAKPLENGDRPGVLEAVLDLLSGSLRPTVMVIEDTHWADEATFDAIKYLGRRIPGTNGLLLLTYRDGEVDYDHPLRGVIGDLPLQNVIRVQLTGLSLPAVSQIVGDSEMDPSEVLAATHGNPFLVTEMASSDGGGVPPSVQDSVMARVMKLSPESLQLLKTLSVIPERISRVELARIAAGSDSGLVEAERRGLIEVEAEFVAFRHELIRRAVESSLTTSERETANRSILAILPPEATPARFVHHAREANDIDLLVEFAPKSARSSAALGSHREAVAQFRQLTPHLDRLDPDEKGPILRQWATEEAQMENIPEGIRLNELALLHYRERGDRRAESRALAQAVLFHENVGQKRRAEELAHQAVDVLGPNPNGADLARALEAKAYLRMMEGDVAGTMKLVDQVLEVGGPDLDERYVIRSLNHRGVVTDIAEYPAGRPFLDQARDRAEAAGLWYEESRALFNHAWAALEFRDLAVASDYAQRAIASAVRHELLFSEHYASAIHALVLELEGKWDEAEDIARELLDRSAITQMVVLTLIATLDARKGRATAPATLTQAWEICIEASEYQRLGPIAIAAAEYAWISGSSDIPLEDVKGVMERGINLGFEYSSGSIAFWLWKLGELSAIPSAIAEPYRLVMEGKPTEAEAIWEAKGIPYERGLALMHGDEKDRLDALEVFETLGATAVAAKLRKTLRDEGVSVPRGKSRDTRRHAAGLTARQTEVLQLLDQGLTNIEIADRLFVSPRTVENHVSAVLTKLDSSTRDEAVVRARTEGLLTMSGARSRP